MQSDSNLYILVHSILPFPYHPSLMLTYIYLLTFFIIFWGVMRICIFFVMTTSFFSLEAQYFAEDLSVFFIAVVLAQRRCPQAPGCPPCLAAKPESQNRMGDQTHRHAAVLTTPNFSKLAAFIWRNYFFSTFNNTVFICRTSDSLCRRMRILNSGLLQYFHWKSDAVATQLDIIHWHNF